MYLSVLILMNKRDKHYIQGIKATITAWERGGGQERFLREVSTKSGVYRWAGYGYSRVQEKHSCQRGQYEETHSGREIQGVLGETTNDLSHSTHLALVLGKMERCGPCLLEVLMQVTRLLERALLQCLGWTTGTSLTSGLLSSWGPPKPQEGSQCVSSGLNYFVKFS